MKRILRLFMIYLASDDARFITGVALPIDGGTTAGH